VPRAATTMAARSFARALLLASMLGHGNVHAFSPTSLPFVARPHSRGLAPSPIAAAAVISPVMTCVVTDMDETLISKKSTGYVVSFLVKYRAILRLLLLPLLSATLIPLSKVSRSLAVRIMYWFAFRGVRVDKANRIASDFLGEKYARDLQDPAASAVLAAESAVIITASPTFMARPWLEKYLAVPAANVYGAELAVRNGRFTGQLMGAIPIGEAKVELLKSSVAASASSTVGYGDHPTDVPFLEACDRGVLVHALPADQKGTCEYQPAAPFDLSKLSALSS